MDRRDFIGTSAVLGALGLVGSNVLLSSCSGNGKGKIVPLKQPGEYYIPELPDKAIDGREIKVGVVGCGARGSGAVKNVLDAADGVKITALGDVFPDRLNSLREILIERGMDVPDESCFIGFDAYKKVIDSGVDAVILTTPPAFRPMQFQYATEKGVHSFLEKPVAVDPKGYRQIMATAKQAEARGLCVVTGTQRHHKRAYVESFKKIQEGMIGEIVSGNVYWNQGMLWYRERQQGWSDMEWMIRDWVNWKWLSGDHICEQHVHNIDVFNWMIGRHPLTATGFGSRQRRVTGDQYDNFSVDFDYGGGVHLHSMCRQIDGCSNNVTEQVHGKLGWWNSEDFTIRDYSGNILWQFDLEAEKAEHSQTNPYVLEHVDWINHIRRGTAHDEAAECAMSSLCGIMGRESAYAGSTVTWDEISASPLDYLPEKLELGKVDMSGYTVQVPGAKK